MSTTSAHRYRIQVECIDGASTAPLSFEVQQHDDLLAIVERVRHGTAFAADDALALAVGLKLFTGVMLGARHDPLFAEIQPAMRRFIGNLKSRIAASTANT
ncbi:DUF3861 domain-containing protein [Dyella acidiphila]|uniref:DUF3861 domain-containing protein n=1 Tax=Dyella acidiphila TaxID=2775866 RepID=A0ABR9GCF4_9GAMM|nr:DUF3861 domain-containing protein [Dyella acidiphila]MBE1161732.1 DUF3861 domain-containing protein [Dyella acidiphila]